MFKPYFDVSEMSDWNLDHVNAYIADITDITDDLGSFEIKNVKFQFDLFKATGYHEAIEDYDENDGEQDDDINTIVELNDDEKSLRRFTADNLDLERVIIIWNSLKFKLVLCL